MKGTELSWCEIPEMHLFSINYNGKRVFKIKLNHSEYFCLKTKLKYHYNDLVDDDIAIHKHDDIYIKLNQQK